MILIIKTGQTSDNLKFEHSSIIHVNDQALKRVHLYHIDSLISFQTAAVQYSQIRSICTDTSKGSFINVARRMKFIAKGGRGLEPKSYFLSRPDNIDLL